MFSFFAAIFMLGLCLTNAINFTTVYEWDQFDFIWPGANSSYERNFIQNYVDLRCMAVFGERLFLCLDNTYSGIAASVAWLPTSGTTTAPPKLAPFPSWDFYEKGDHCDSLQLAYGMETDTDGLLWVLDTGSNICPSKLWIFDLVNNDTTDRIHQFPDSVVSHSYIKRWLLDIVLDKKRDDHFAYIADSESEKIVVYSKKMDKSWLVNTPGKRWVHLALSPKTEARQLYLRRFNSYELYSVSVSELRSEYGSAAVKFIGTWTGTSYRMLIDSANVMYVAIYDRNYISKWNILEPFLEQRFYEVGGLTAIQPFTFALDKTNTLWMTERNRSARGIRRHKLLKAAVVAKP